MTSRARPSGDGQLPSLRRGVQLEIGPFLVRVRSELPALDEHLRTQYRDFPMREVEDCHFDVAVVGGRGLRRWIRPQAILAVNGARPYLPLPADLAGPVLEWGLNYCIGTRVAPLRVGARGGRREAGQGVDSLGAFRLREEHALRRAGLFGLAAVLRRIRPDRPVYRTRLPAPRPVALKEAAIDIIRRRHPDVVYGPEKRDMEGLRFVHARPPSDSVRPVTRSRDPGWIVLPKYAAGKPTTFEPLSKAQALMELAGQSFNYNYLPNGFDAPGARRRQQSVLCARVQRPR